MSNSNTTPHNHARSLDGAGDGALDGAAMEIGNLPESAISDPEDSPESIATMPVYDYAAVEKQIEIMIGRPYYGEQEEYLGSPLPVLNDANQARLDRLIYLHGDAHQGRRSLLFGTQKMIDGLARVREACPGFEAVVDLVTRAAILSLRTTSPLFVPPVLLVGPPGTGKTHASKTIAAALGTDIHAISCSTNSDAQALVVGHPISWKGAEMGKLTKAVATGTTAQPVLLLDEVDKLQSHWDEPYGTLLTVLERENSAALVDQFLDIAFDLSKAIIIATANDLTRLPDYILDRLTILSIAAPRGNALLAVTRLVAVDVVAELQGAVAMPADEILHRAARHNPRRLGKLLRLGFGYAAAAGRDHLVIADVDAAEALFVQQDGKPTIGFLSGNSDARRDEREGILHQGSEGQQPKKVLRERQGF